MIDQPTPDQAATKPSCGNCCNAQRSARAVGRVLCTALPPAVIARGNTGLNVYPEMDAAKLGCTTFWNVNAQLFHILGQAVTLATQPQAASEPNGKQGESSPGNPAGVDAGA